MSSLARHIVHQGPMIKTVLDIAFRAALGPLRPVRGLPETLPVPPLLRRLPPRPPGMIQDYIACMGGDPAWYGPHIPPHLYAQWGFPIMWECIKYLPYNVAKVLNAGCRIEINRPLPVHEPLEIAANIDSIDDNGARAILTHRLVTGTASAPEAIVCYTNSLFRLKQKGGKKKGEKKEEPEVPAGAREIDRWALTKRSGLEFACLTGDFNPMHWVRPYARLSGFKSVILHGFATLARCVESVNRHVLDEQPERLGSIEVRFTRPVVLPREVGVFVDDRGGVFVGDAPGAVPYMTGSYKKKETNGE